MRNLNLLILGAGVHGQDVYDIARSLRVFSRIEFLDDNPYLDNILGEWKDAMDFVSEFPVAIVAVADEDTRKKWTQKLIGFGYIIPTLIHPTAYIPEGVKIGSGTVICARVTVSVGSVIGENCIVTSGSIIPRKTILPNWAYFEIENWTFHKEKYVIPERMNKPDER